MCAAVLAGQLSLGVRVTHERVAAATTVFLDGDYSTEEEREERECEQFFTTNSSFVRSKKRKED
jgi:hypothetical protein